MDLIAYILAKKKAAAYTDSKVAGIESGLDYKGSVATIEDLPSSATKGDEYTVGDLGTYAWDGTAWKPAGVKGGKGDKGDQGEQGIPGKDGAMVVTVSETGTATDSNGYITIDGVEHKIAQPKPNDADATTAKLTKLKIDGINYALQGGGASVFANYQTMITELNSKAKQDLELGWNIYIRTIDVPDLWVSKNDETTSVPYTYVSDAQFISDLRTASTSGLQIGYYRVNQLEAEKVNVPVQDVQVAGTSVLSGGIANIPLAESSNAGVIKVSSGNGVALASGTLVGAAKDYSAYTSADNRLVMCKGTLENVITGKSQSYSCEMADGTTKTLTLLGSLA